ncbi:Protein of unknown function (DUF3071) [Flavimobilis soli]|uniref:DUF3071 domain-containing protein n=1 Tax=Flavimobilis soli TaxID=442709 RepID=A0A2A9EB58_9MICO|nr:septation protein SepH [Flavimobilis soli]PFG35505.1 Protein of unknown function (DUF3071) [Flavimobilis soli]
MADLELIGLDEDGEHIVLASSDGARFRLRIDEPLRAAVRRDRPQLEQLRQTAPGSLPPREIQAQVRAGLTAEEVAESAGISVEHVRRYEGPVLAEREYVAEQARATRVGRDAGSPNLGDLVTDRLAARHVDTEELRWDAWRPVGSSWMVSVSYEVGDAEHRAVWAFDQQARTLTATDDESRWISETRLHDEVVPRRHLSPVRGDVFDVEASGPISDLEPAEPAGFEDTTSALLDDLSARRGVRQLIDVEEPEDDDEGLFGLASVTQEEDLDADAGAPVPVEAIGRLYSLGDRSPRSAAEVGETTELPLTEDVPEPPAPEPEAPVPAPEAPAAADPTPPPLERAARGGRKGRPQVPSWDEIVFGARTDD